MKRKTKTNIITETYRKHGLNRRQIAQFVGTHEQTVYKWEVGEREPSASVVCLFEALDVMMTTVKGKRWVRSRLGGVDKAA
tara:strand:- start:777 stop:1019 length:243 start_codon:yes stop_codon:yes gene_type:complete